MSFKKPKLTRDEVSQTIDLKDLFGDLDLSGLDNAKQLLGQAMLDRIKERTKSGVAIYFDTNGNARYGKFKKYSKAYTQSQEFKSFNKSPGEVNLTLTGDMLELMDFEVSGDKIKIGWNDDVENAKAYNHNVGDTLPKRPFFGVSKSELQLMVAEYKTDLEKAVKAQDTSGTATAEEMIQKLIDKLSG